MFQVNIAVSGDITITDTSADPFLKLATSDRNYVIRVDNSDADKFQIRDVTASATRLSISADGIATFGNTVEIPSVLRHVGDTDTYIQFTDGEIDFFANGRDGFMTSSGGFVVNPDSANYDFIVRGDNVQNLIYGDASADKVGIGISTPASKLHVYETSNNVSTLTNLGTTADGATVRIENNSTTTGSYASLFLRADTGDVRIAAIRKSSTSNDVDLAFVLDDASESTSVERMRIVGDSGNVGIGTSSPSEKLHVAGNITADSKVFDADVQVPNQNLLDISNIQISNANDIYSNATKTVIDDFKATFANDNTGGTTIRIYVDDGILVDGENYTVSVYYEGLVGTLSMDWCDVALTGSHKSATGTTSSPASGRIYGYASKADYTSTFRFIDINLSQGANDTVTLFHPKVEEGTQVTDFVGTERTNQEGNSKDLNNLNVTGKVGVGTSLPGQKLDVIGSARIAGTNGTGTADYTLLVENTNTSQAIIKFKPNSNRNIGPFIKSTPRGNAASDGDIQIGDENGTIATFNVGRVGIGTQSPGQPLHVKFSGDSGVKIESDTSHSSLFIDSDTGYGQYIRFSQAGSNKYWLNSDTNGNLLFRPAATGVEANMITFNSAGRVGIGKTTVKAKLQVEEYGIDTTSTASSATTQIAIHSFAAADFRSARFTVQVTNSTDSTYHTTELLLVHNGTTANITEFGEIHTGSAVEATFDADISSGNVRLLATPASTDTMAFKVVCHSITT